MFLDGAACSARRARASSAGEEGAQDEVPDQSGEE